MLSKAGIERCMESHLKFKEAVAGKILYRDDHCLGPPDLFSGLDCSFIDSKVKQEYKLANKKAFAVRVFTDFFAELIDEVVDSGNIYIFPTKGHSYIRVEEMARRKVLWKIQSGIYQFVDLIATDFKIYHVVCRAARKYKEIRINRDTYMRLCKHAEGGKRYCAPLQPKR